MYERRVKSGEFFLCKNTVKQTSRFVTALLLPKKLLKEWSNASTKGGKRLAVKVIVWRILSVVITLLITFLMTGDFMKASGLTMVLHFVLMIVHWIFESTWEQLGD